mmetsp:Transcript_49816/g.63821  ORF Transcript_49816/g.63821 Transcript_49816/m.63821 type:complete len:114 (-) Transcript_49816:430-771(-)
MILNDGDQLSALLSMMDMGFGYEVLHPYMSQVDICNLCLCCMRIYIYIIHSPLGGWDLSKVELSNACQERDKWFSYWRNHKTPNYSTISRPLIGCAIPHKVNSTEGVKVRCFC